MQTPGPSHIPQRDIHHPTGVQDISSSMSQLSYEEGFANAEHNAIEEEFRSK